MKLNSKTYHETENKFENKIENVKLKLKTYFESQTEGALKLMFHMF
jgi:hypothetical protein